MAFLDQLSRGINVNPAGAFQEGQAAGTIDMANKVTLLNQIEARARQAQIPQLFQRTLSGDPEAAGMLAVNAPQAFNALTNMQNAAAQREAQFVKASMGPKPTSAMQNFNFRKTLPEHEQKIFDQNAGGQRIIVNPPGQVNPLEAARQEARFAGIKEREIGLSKLGVKTYADFAQQVDDGDQSLDQMRRFRDSMVAAGESGPVAKATIPFLNFFASIGALTPEQEARLANMESAQALGEANRLAMSKFMKGAISNAEQEMMERAALTIGRSYEGNLLLFAAYEDMQRRKTIVFNRVTEELEELNRTGKKAPLVQSLINKHRKQLSEEDPLLNQQFMEGVLNSTKNKSGMLQAWNASPGFTAQLRLSNVFDKFPSVTSKKTQQWINDPSNRGKFVFIGNKLDFNE